MKEKNTRVLLIMIIVNENKKIDVLQKCYAEQQSQYIRKLSIT